MTNVEIPYRGEKKVKPFPFWFPIIMQISVLSGTPENPVLKIRLIAMGKQYSVLWF
jgi:hypothetical protein